MTRFQKIFWLCALFALAFVPQGTLRLMAQLPRPVPEARINVETEPGDNFGEKLRSCIRRLVPKGGTCDALSISGKQVVRIDPFTEAVGPLRVLLGNVTIEVSQPWGLPDNSELEGRGRSTVLLLAPGVNSDFIRNAGGTKGNHEIFIHDLVLDGNGINQTGTISTVRLTNVSRFTIEHVSILNSVAHAVALEDGCSHGRLLNNHIEVVSAGSAIRAGNAPSIGSVDSIEISGNEISQVAKGGGIFVVGSGPELEHTHGVKVNANTISGVRGASIEVGEGAQDVTVTGNHVELKGAPGGSSSSTGIAVRSAKNVQVTDNVISGDPAEHEQVGLLAWATTKHAPLANVTMENNTVSDIAGYGILVESGDAIHLLRNTVRRCAKSEIQVAREATGVTQVDNNLEAGKH
ncbi:MAG TPA: right-handed parallel beta-helix repeat-containing protein [Candidatus Angelobacter sp.]|jgi:hypothetical protein